jgi:hypothetical protein
MSKTDEKDTSVQSRASSYSVTCFNIVQPQCSMMLIRIDWVDAMVAC